MTDDRGWLTPHYTKAVGSSGIPHRHIFMDTEALESEGPMSTTQTWRCGVTARFRSYRDRAPTLLYERWADPKQMWQAIDQFTEDKRRTVLWAHNLSYDLRVAQALKWTGAFGWELEDIRLSRQGTWARWRRGTRSLIAVDTHSVFPTSVAKLGTMIGLPKLELPDGDDLEAWFARCRRDVEIITQATLSYLDWLKECDLGPWRVTGAGQSWAAWQRRWHTHRVLVSDHLGARDAESRAMWTGRAEAWRHGRRPAQRVYEWDMQAAYARIARDCELPTAQRSIAHGSTLRSLERWRHRYAVLAEVEVETEAPVVPTEHNGGIVWPVGRFVTTLWDPEIALLAESGAGVRVARVWLYRKEPALAAWGAWVLDQLADHNGAVPAHLRTVIKHWSRTLVGRFAMKFTGWEPWGDYDVDDLRVWDGSDMDTGDRFSLMQVGTEVRRSTEEQYGRDAFPAITGYVMSECRARLWRTLRAVGEENVIYMDTDSLILTVGGHRKLLGLSNMVENYGWKFKGEHRGYDIIGARKIILGTQRRVAGVPVQAQQTGRWRFSGEVWDGLAESVRRGEPDAVRIVTRSFHVKSGDTRRRRVKGGRMVPYRLGAD